MNIRFRLAWAKGPVGPKHFKSSSSHALFSEYLKRLAHFAPSSASGVDLRKPEEGRGRRWFCHPAGGARQLSSEDLARSLEKLRQAGAREWEVIIGPADGFTPEHLQLWKPDFLWSFGLLTLPHELAAVVASEQVYRAFTILNGQPYHSGH